jgi:hypothetical protein
MRSKVQSVVIAVAPPRTRPFENTIQIIAISHCAEKLPYIKEGAIPVRLCSDGSCSSAAGCKLQDVLLEISLSYVEIVLSLRFR